MVFLLITVITISMLSLLLVSSSGTIIDENNYIKAIGDVQRFDFFSYTITQYITALPGYTYAIGLISLVLGITTLNGLRVLSFLMAVGGIPLFYLLARKDLEKGSIFKTLQFYFLPVLFPFFFLLYTDAFSLVFVLGMFYLVTKKRYNTAGIIGLLGLAVRQNSIIWYSLAFAASYLHEEGWKLSWGAVVRQLKRAATFIIGVIVFITFAMVNNGFALGDRAMHPAFAFHVENIYFALFLIFFLSLPFQVMHWRQHMQLLKKPLTWFGIITIVAGYILFFRVTHPFNIVSGVWRNHLFWLIQQHVYLQLLFLLAVIFAFLFLLNTKLQKPYNRLFYPAVIAVLLPSWLIEPRYYIVPFALFILWREVENEQLELLQTGWSALLSICMFTGIILSGFML